MVQSGDVSVQSGFTVYQGRICATGRQKSVRIFGSVADRFQVEIDAMNLDHRLLLP